VLERDLHGVGLAQIVGYRPGNGLSCGIAD
jgi:hypothetical protein